MEEFDYIIVGGGSSGCVMAERLSANPMTKVLMIERGRGDFHPWIHIPAAFFKILKSGRDIKNYVAAPSSEMGGRPTIVPTGKVIGGGSSVNAMLYVRGQSEDYDNWVQLGAKGWSYNDCLPVFRDLENNEVFGDTYHGQSGDLHVSAPKFRHPLSEAFVAAAQETGIPHNPDFNGSVQEGVGFYQTTTHNGRRWSAAQAFLRKAEKRPNLKILKNAEVAKLTFEGTRATGVLLSTGQQMRARAEVVMCAGAFESPRLLQLSGIGNGEELRALGISVISDLLGVGENYQDHLESTVQCETLQPISNYRHDKGLRAALHMMQYLTTRSGLLTSNVCETGGFIDVSDCGIPDLQFHVLPAMVAGLDRPAIEAHGISIGQCFLRPQSRGSYKIRSSDPHEKPVFVSGALTDQRDVDLLMRGVRKSIEIMDSPALAKHIKRRHMPEPGVETDDSALEQYVRKTAKTLFHPSCTVKMGADTDRMACLDSELRVRGVQGLRVCDASAMPALISGNTNAPTIMIAERGARFILGKETAA
ncbi:GMC family oxidoreductase [Loktanella sp. S4079]|uniref:GMC family oxidoreductase n=1 Tax=Loktanella sp. S4079 TaxID=579483 RepID=UPI0005F9FDA4|nr:FAD-dependent oxidoreductase [Loktanella sp. S4079]KJZ18427.1 GMC family oxidoreductase [Loktanella sp. S4079]